MAGAIRKDVPRQEPGNEERGWQEPGKEERRSQAGAWERRKKNVCRLCQQCKAIVQIIKTELFQVLRN
jgi:hypothetical protein